MSDSPQYHTAGRLTLPMYDRVYCGEIDSTQYDTPKNLNNPAKS